MRDTYVTVHVCNLEDVRRHQMFELDVVNDAGCGQGWAAAGDGNTWVWSVRLLNMGHGWGAGYLRSANGEGDI